MTTTCEEWRPVVGYEGTYEVSIRGRVRSIDRSIAYRDGSIRFHRGCERKQHSHKGYRCLITRTGGLRRALFVHQMVCLAFHGPRPSQKHGVRHLNGNQLDNRAENLTWGTQAENMQDRVLHGNNHNKQKTHCHLGHAFSGANLRIDALGRRVCRKCEKARRARRHAIRKRAQL